MLRLTHIFILTISNLGMSFLCLMIFIFLIQVCFLMASSSSKYRPKVRKDKSIAMEEEAPLQKRPTVEDVLDQKRYFNTVKQMENYGNHFYHRRIIEPKIMNLESFMDSGLYFHQHLLFQGLSNYVTLSYSYFPELMVFYTNLHISGNGYLMSEVNKKKIKLKPSD